MPSTVPPPSSSPALLHLHPSDNVAVAVRAVAPQSSVALGRESITAVEEIPAGHKLATREIAAGEIVTKYGNPIGLASQPIAAGAWVHCHNVTLDGFHRTMAEIGALPPAPPKLERTFMGYKRPDRRAGTRNYIAVISSVNCSAAVCKAVAARFTSQELAGFENVDGVLPFTHGEGCGLQFGGLRHETLNRTLAGIAKHPNIGAYLIIGLGCENAPIGYLMDSQHLYTLDAASKKAERPIVLSMQDVGGTQATIEAGVAAVKTLLPLANAFRREPVGAENLCVALKCGGSDGNSGITANPALGVASDRIVACGGTAVLSETTEIWGAEQLLTRRARTPEVAKKLMDRLAWWEWYAGVFGASIDGNPSAGNKAGGLTNIVEKSLGAVAKAGGTVFEELYLYAEQVTKPGLVVMDTPGFDPVCVTGMVAGGANVVVFTTGRGSCFGCKPSPSIKVATNTPMYERMKPDMDLNAGEILNGQSVEKCGETMFEEILAVASGKKTKSESQGLGLEEFVPWQCGPVL